MNRTVNKKGTKHRKKGCIISLVYQIDKTLSAETQIAINAI